MACDNEFVSKTKRGLSTRQYRSAGGTLFPFVDVGRGYPGWEPDCFVGERRGRGGWGQADWVGGGWWLVRRDRFNFRFVSVEKRSSLLRK